MASYLTREGDIIEASSKKELVEKLRSYTSFTQTQRLPVYMDGYAFMVQEIFGKQISTASVNVFVDDLIKKKILKKLSSSEIKKYQNRQGLK